MPIIAIAPCDKLRDYEEAVRRAGGDVRVLDRAVDRPADVIAIGRRSAAAGRRRRAAVDLWRGRASRRSQAAEPGRDDYELELARRAVEADLPLLAICRGIQVLNVARGRHARSGHSERARLDGQPHAARPAASRSRTTSGSPKERLLDRLMRERSRR